MAKREKPWHKNAPNLLIVNSILAAIAAIVIQATHGGIFWLLCGIMALLLFIISAEKITEAFDEDNVRTYVAYFIPYNLGVALLFVAVFGIIINYPSSSLPIDVASSVILIFLWWIVWGKDSSYLLRRDNVSFKQYLDKLEGKDSFEDGDGDLWTKYFFNFRLLLGCKRAERRLPHDNVYVRLRPSPIHGVGVFAIAAIKKDTAIFPDDEKIIWVDGKDVAVLPLSIKRLYEDFAIIKDDRYGCPVSFNKLTPGWYLNDSDRPNVRVDENYEMFALRDISEGEELTIDSAQFSEQPYRAGKNSANENGI